MAVPGKASRWPADLSLLAATFVWGSTFVVVKDGLGDASPSAFLAVRFAIGALAFVPILAARGELWDLASVRLWRDGALIGILLGGGFFLQTWGLRFTAPSRSAYITSLYVLIVPFLLVVVERRKPGRAPLAGALIAAAGLTLLCRPGLAPPNIGDALTLGCAFVFAGQILAVDAFTRRHRPLPLAFAEILTTLPLFGIGLALEPFRWQGTPRLLFALAVTGLLATSGALAIQVWAQRRTSPVRAAVIFAMEPVFAVLFAVLLQRERVGALEILGGALIVGGILVAELPGRFNLSPVGLSNSTSETGGTEQGEPT